MSRRVLIISPHFPPINAPDHQRVRMSLPYFRELGWEATVLTVQPAVVEGFQDPLLEQTLPDDIKVIQVSALNLKFTRRLGLGSLAIRSLPYMYRAGSKLLAKERYDLVYFSTTMFMVMVLGPLWQRRFGVPYVLDFQDPWLSDYIYKEGDTPPGGRWKYGFSQALARTFEPVALRSVSHVISVSPAYPETLMSRYQWLDKEHFTVLPFGAPERDFEMLPVLGVNQSIFDDKDGNRHWVYVGRCNSGMLETLRNLFKAIKLERDYMPSAWCNIRLHFVGTGYTPGSGTVVVPIAQAEGIADMVTEYPERISYFAALKTMVDSDLVMLIGSDDPGYTASKIYPCILANRPIYGIFHEESSVVSIIAKCRAGRIATFSAKITGDKLVDKIREDLQWILSLPKNYTPDVDWQTFDQFTARSMATIQRDIFDRCLTKHG